jgi:deoxyribodipyrimidine photo-lyase
MNLFIFHRDLRLYDNTSLILQAVRHKKVTPIFIFTPQQITPQVNPYFSNNSVQFMVETLSELSKEIESLGGKLYYFYGNNIDVLQSISKKQKISSLYYNIDYTPFAKRRDLEIS